MQGGSGFRPAVTAAGAGALVCISEVFFSCHRDLFSRVTKVSGGVLFRLEDGCRRSRRYRCPEKQAPFRNSYAARGAEFGCRIVRKMRQGEQSRKGGFYGKQV